MQRSFVTMYYSHSDVYKQVGWHDPSDSEMVSLLRTAVGNSLSKHYHGGKGIDVLSPEGNM